jgi:tRNA threonylcarbamoyladenosine biosynthesis protein TsaE
MRSHSRNDTLAAGRSLAQKLTRGDCVLLEGGLGAGKTVFAKGVAEGLGVDSEEVRSPTFTLINVYRGRLPVYHVDLYRVEKPEDLEELGLEEVLGTDGVAMVEWPDRLGRYLPDRYWRVRIDDLGGEAREITLREPCGRASPFRS